MPEEQDNIKPHHQYLDSIISQCKDERRWARAKKEWRWNTVFWVIQTMAVLLKNEIGVRKGRKRRLPKVSGFSPFDSATRPKDISRKS